jgi:hypothetical protein
LVSITVGREQFRNAEPRFYTAWTHNGLTALMVAQKLRTA